MGAPAAPAGAKSTGRINRLLVGQSYGFIRGRDGREIFFHRSDVAEGTSFNDLEVGEPVAFELLEDAISGARAIKVKPRPR
jgi:cold shock CspA family protein